LGRTCLFEIIPERRGADRVNRSLTNLRRLIVPITVFLTAVLVATGCFDAARANPSESISVRNNRLFVQVVVDDVKTEAILDSGAEMTFLDQDFASAMGLVTQGGNDTRARGSGAEEVAVQFARDVTLSSVGITLENLTVAILDLSDVTERLVGHRVDLVLGRELFDSARLRLDLEEGSIEPVDRAKDPEGMRLTLETHHGIETIPVMVEDYPPVRAEFDLGNGSDVLIGREYAESIGLLHEDRIVGIGSGGGIGGAIERKIVVLRRLDVAGIPFFNVRAAIDASDKAGEVNVGVAVLRNFIITTDFPEGAVWLAPRHEIQTE
jgi:hypothetical protein